MALLAGCGGGGGKQSTSTTIPAGASSVKGQIEQNWRAFFDGSTPAAKRISLLESGGSFASLLRAIGGSSLAKEVKATVSAVRVDGPNKATVTYSVLLAGQPVLQNSRGTAVLVNGTWKVGTASFCSLLKLEGVVPAACGSGGK